MTDLAASNVTRREYLCRSSCCWPAGATNMRCTTRSLCDTEMIQYDRNQAVHSGHAPAAAASPEPEPLGAGSTLRNDGPLRMTPRRARSASMQKA